MRYLITFLFITTASFAGLESAKKNHAKKLTALRKRYIYDLKREKQAAFMRGGSTVAIDREISRITILLTPLNAKFTVKYSTGVRHYRFKDGKVYFDQDKTSTAYKRTGNTIIFRWPVGAIETWVKKGDSWDVIFETPEGKIIEGKAKVSSRE